MAASGMEPDLQERQLEVLWTLHRQVYLGKNHIFIRSETSYYYNI